MKKTSIIIANYNGEKYLPTCLNSVLKNDFKKFEIVVYDDGSTDNSINIISKFQKKDSRVKLIKGDNNIGASAARNLAVKNTNSDVLIFLDNDTQVKENWLKELMRTLEKYEDVGVVQSLMIDFERRDILQVGQLRLWAATGWGLAEGAEKKLGNKYEEVETMAMSTATAVKREVFETIGGFDEKEAVYTEDLDFFWRAWVAGFKIRLSPNAVVYHLNKNFKMRRGMNATATKIYFHLCKNSLRSIAKNYEIQNVFKFLSQSILINFGRALVVMTKRGDLSALVGSTKGLIWFVTNLPDTLSERKKLNRVRKACDKELFNRIIIQESLFSTYRKYYT